MTDKAVFLILLAFNMAVLLGALWITDRRYRRYRTKAERLSLELATLQGSQVPAMAELGQEQVPRQLVGNRR